MFADTDEEFKLLCKGMQRFKDVNFSLEEEEEIKSVTYPQQQQSDVTPPPSKRMKRTANVHQPPPPPEIDQSNTSFPVLSLEVENNDSNFFN